MTLRRFLRVAAFGMLGLIFGMAPPIAHAGNVLLAPVVNLTFTPATVAAGATTQIRFDIGNSNASSLVGVNFTATLPAGISVATIGSTAIGCGTVSATAPSTISYTNGTIPANTPSTNSPCNFEINIATTTSGVYTATTTTINSGNGLPGNPASGMLVVAAPPTIIKSFGAATVGLNNTTTLNFVVSNPNSNVPFTGVAFTDNLPSGLVIAAAPNVSNTCGGTFTATPGANSAALSAGTLASNASCNVSVTLLATSAGVKNNTVQVSSTEGGTGNTSNTSITVVAPPTLSASFGAPSIAVGASTSLGFTLTNPNASGTLNGVAFSDTLPAGLVVATPNGLTSSCGGTATATAGSGSVSLSGATLAAGASCTLTLNVTGTSAGTKSNVTGAISSTESGAGGTASASLNVDAPPTLAAAFAPTTVMPGGTSTLTFTLVAPAANPDTLTGIGFTNTLPAGISAATASASACGGTVTTTTPSTITLAGATLAPGVQCQIAIVITAGAAGGSYTVTTGAVGSANGGSGGTASATLQVSNPGPIPALDRSGLLLLAALLVGLALLAHRQKS